MNSAIDPLSEVAACRRIKGDLAQESGPLQVEGDILIEGSVRDGAVIHATGSAVVQGVVESARLDAEGTIHVEGGIVGKRKASLSGARGITGKFCSHASLSSLGDIAIDTEIVQSTVIARGAIQIPAGIISGGRIIGNGGVSCRVAGNSSGCSTEIGAGFHSLFDENAEAELAKLEAILKQARSVREKVEPLMQHQKSLSAAQKEKAIELLYEASEAEQRAADSLRQMHAAVDEIDAQALPEILVNETLHTNVTVRFRGAHATTRMDFKGPLKLTLGHSEGLPAVCATDMENGKSCYFETTSYRDPTAAVRAAVREWLNKHASH